MASKPRISFEVIQKLGSNYIVIRMKCNKSGYTDRVTLLKKQATDARIRESKEAMKQSYDITQTLKGVKLV